MKRVLIALLLAGCSHAEDTPTVQENATPATGLEAAAIDAGVIPDPASTDISGLYARDADRVCIVPSATAYRIGVLVDYGEGHNCSASGKVAQSGDTLDMDFPAAPGCTFTARFDGDKIVFPGKVPEACQQLCRGRASIAALDLDRLSESVSEAVTLRDVKGRLLCDG